MKFLRWLPWLLFSVYFGVGVSVFKDYGISFDEPINRVNGIVSMQYVGEKLGVLPPADDIPKLHQYYDRDYSVIFEIPLLVAEKVFRLNSDEKSHLLYPMRHLLTFLTFFMSVVFFYLTALYALKKQWIALLGSLFLILSPRIFAESFYNGKDIVCLSFFIISTYFLVRFIQRPDFKNTLWLTVLSAITINVRLTAVLIPALVVGWGMIDVLIGYRRISQVLFRVGRYLVLTGLFTVAFWPFLWEAPLQNFIYAFQSMSRFRFDMDVLFWGQRLPAPALPRYYILAYTAITTPLLYLVLSFLGIGKVSSNIFKALADLKSSLQTESLRYQLTFLALLVAPFCAVIALKSVLYDGWRQLYFTYGAFLLLSLYGVQAVVQWLSSNATFQKWTIGVVVVCCSWTAVWMFKNHPYQHAYFNILAPQPIEKQFDIDYWGLSYRQGLEWILAHDKRPKIKIIANLPPGTHNLMMLRPEEKARLECQYIKPAVRDTLQTSALQCDYFLTEFRYHDTAAPYQKQLHEITVDRHRILAIYDGRITKNGLQ